MKTELKVGDSVYFLYAQHLQTGTVKKINKKTISVSYITWGWDGQKGVDRNHVKLVQKERVANAVDEFAVVWEINIGVEGRYYITYDEFPECNKTGNHWSQPYTYVTK